MLLKGCIYMNMDSLKKHTFSLEFNTYAFPNLTHHLFFTLFNYLLLIRLILFCARATSTVETDIEL